MQPEAKNSYFKRIAQISNLKNVTYSVAKWHQRLLCAHLQGQSELECGPSSDCKYDYTCRIHSPIDLQSHALYYYTSMYCVILGKDSGGHPLEDDDRKILQLLPGTSIETFVSRYNVIMIITM